MADSIEKNKTVRASAVAVALLVAIAALIAIAVLRHGEPGSLPTAVAADKLTIRKMSGEESQSWVRSEMKKTGAKIGVVNIWATWCEPCREEMPEFAKFQKSGLAPVFLISADNEADEDLVRSFLIETGVSFESALVKGDQQKFVEIWQELSSDDPNKRWSMGLPATFVIDSEGRVKSFMIGGTNERELIATVKKAMASTLDTARD